MSVLEADNVRVAFGAAEILNGVCFSLRAGEMVGLIGPNGAGKSTLLNGLSGILTPDGGTVALDGRPIDVISREERAQSVGYLEQNAVAHWPLRVDRLVALGRIPHLSPLRRQTAEDERAVEAAMAACDVVALAARRVTTLSGGERLRVMLARVLAGTPSLILADEPVAGLDPLHQLETMKLLHGLTRQGVGVAVVLHDLTLAARYCDRLCLLSQGQVRADGLPIEVLESDAAASAFGVTLKVAETGGVRVVVTAEKVL